MRANILLLIFLFYLISVYIYAMAKQYAKKGIIVVDEETEENTTFISKIHPLLPPRVQRASEIPLELSNDKYLQKHFIYSKGRRNVDFVMGLPTVLRPNKRFYLTTTLHSLVSKMSPGDLRNNLIVICIGETQRRRVDRITEMVRTNFSVLMEQGLIDIIAPARAYYKHLRSLRQTLNDNKERVYWRSKQNLDYIFMMSYALGRGKFYLQLEDDIIAYNDYLSFMRKFMVMHDTFRLPEQRPWLVCSFSELGCIGKVLAMKDLLGLIKFVKLFFNDQPIDWLMLAYAEMKACPWKGLLKEQCQQELDKIWIRSLQSQFQHIGTQSSLSLKLQNITDNYYGRQYWPRPKQWHLKEPWSIIHSHSYHMSRTKNYADLAVQKEEIYFWGYLPKPNDMVKHLFQNHLGNRQYRIQTNNRTISSNDDLQNVLVEILPKKEARAIRRNQSEPLGRANKSEGFIIAFKFMKQKQHFSIVKRGFYVYDDGHGSTWWRTFFPSSFCIIKVPSLMVVLMKTLIIMYFVN